MDVERFLPSLENRPDLIYTLPEIYFPREMNYVVEMLDRHIEDGKGDIIAYYFQKADGSTEKITYLQVHQNANRVGNMFRSLGVKKGDRVLMSLQEGPDLIYAILGAIKIGAICVPFSPLCRTKEIIYFIQDTVPKVLIVHPGMEPELRGIDSALLSDVKVMVFPDVSGYESFSKYADYTTTLIPEPTLKSDIAVIFYTSGTTGNPKGCTHTHGELLASGVVHTKHWLKFVPGDVILCPGAAVHAFGYGMKITFPLLGAASAVLYEKFTPENIYKAVHNYRVTHMIFVAPVLYNIFVENKLEGYDLSSIRVLAGLIGSESVCNQLEEVFGTYPQNPIGMAPMAHNFTITGCGEPPCSLGKMMPGYEGYVVSTDKDEIFDKDGKIKELPPGEIGRLVVKGPTGITYWNKPEQAAQDVRFGWNILDDAISRDDKGFLHWHSRTDDIIKTNGHNVSPKEVEGTLVEHPAVEKCAVIGIPDDRRGAVIMAFIRLKAGVEPSEELVKEIQDFTKQKIAPFKYPRRIEFTDNLEQDQLGKISYKKLRARVTQK